MHDTYQVHVTTLGQAKAILDFYRVQGYLIDLEGTNVVSEYLTNYPWICITPFAKRVGGDGSKCEPFITIPFDQAFDLPIRKEKVSFGISLATVTLTETTLTIRDGVLDIQLPAEEFISKLSDARLELSK